VLALRLHAVFTNPQPRPPLARGSVLATHPARDEAWVRGPVVPARPDGAGWRFELFLGDRARLVGMLAAMRIEMVGFAGESLELGPVEVLGGSAADEEGYFTYSEDGDSRTVWSGRAGQVLALHGRVPEGGRLVGEVAWHPARRAVAGPLVAEVSVERRAGEPVVRRFPIETSPLRTVWTPYELPLAALAGEEVTVRLGLGASAEGAALWTEPVLTGPRDRRATGIVLVSVDTLRADAVFPPTGEPAMPLLAARARREGQIVRNQYATANWTLPSHASMLGGRYPSAHGAYDRESLPDFAAEGYLPAALAREGFFTAGITDGAYVSASYGFATGFDEFHESPSWSLEWQSGMLASLLPRLRGQDFFLFVHSYFVHEYLNPVELESAAAPLLPPELRGYFATQKKELRNTLLSWHDPAPGEPRRPSPLFAPLIRELYRQRAAAFDRWLDGFLSSLAREVPGPPLVLVTSDHGESLGEGPGPGVFGHHISLQEDEIRVPLVIFHPDRQPRPAIVDRGSHVDLVPTLRRLVGLAGGGKGAGVDLLDADALARRREVWSESFGDQNGWTAIGRETKLVENVSVGATRRTAHRKDLFRGAPGAFDEARPAPDEPSDVRAAERRRLDQLYGTVDGLFVQLDNPTPREETVEVRLGVSDREAGGLVEWSLPVDLPFQAHFLDPDDDIALASPTKPFAIRFRLPPGDTDLLVVKTAAELSLAVSAPGGRVLVSNGGALSSGDGTLVASRKKTTAFASPPSLPAATDVPLLRIWENRPFGGAPSIPRRHLLSENTEGVLRALGYLR
jgi:arylsulfatase A-like enzyme